MKQKIKYLKLISWVIVLTILSISVFGVTRKVNIVNWQYEPSNLTIGQGMTVVWINSDSGATHRVNIRELTVSSPLLYPDDSFNYTFDKIGTYNFFDAANPVRTKGHIKVIPVEQYHYCGDNKCDDNENKENCCVDCGCDIDYYCFNNVCVKNETKKVEIKNETKETEITGLVTKEEKKEEQIIEKKVSYQPMIIGILITVIIITIFAIMMVIKKR